METSLAAEVGTLAQSNRIAQTKLRPPRLSGGLIPRPHSCNFPPPDLFLVVRITLHRIDLVDETRGWGARETLDL